MHYREFLAPKGNYAKRLRHEECKLARKYQAKNALAVFALWTIEQDRSNVDLRNSKKVMKEKLLFGGHGVFDKEYLRPDTRPSVIRGGDGENLFGP